MKIITAVVAIVAAAPAAAHADDVIVVPFGGDLSGELGGELARATAEVFKLAPDTAPQLARASRADILTLAGCPDGARVCIGQLAATLDIDRAVSGLVLAAGDNKVDIELRVVHRDGAVDTHDMRIDSRDPAVVVDRFKAALAQKLGLARPTATAGVPDSAFKPVEPVAPVRPVEPIETAVPPVESAPVPGRTPEDRPSRLSRIGAGTWAMFGVGALGLGLGTAFLIKAGRTEDEIRSAPSQTAADIQALRDLEDRGDSEKTTGAVMLVVGLAATAGGAALVIRDLTRDRDRDRDGAIAIAPTRGGGAAVSVRGRF